MTKIFNEFCKLISHKIGYTTFSDYYHVNIGIRFKHPRSDTCDYCLKMLKTGVNNMTHEQKAAFDLYLKNVDEYKTLKNDLLNNLDDRLICEFDYSQNKPLPSLVNTAVYYKSSLWLYLFNFYIHNNKSSLMYHYLEGQYKKGANSIISFVFNSLLETDLEPFNEIILFSDSCPGQNKNFHIFSAFIHFANYFRKKITHIFPVKGHSYNVCDRQFGTFNKKMKNISVVEH